MSIMFSATTATVEEAQALYRPELFNPAAVFKTPDGYVMGLLRDQNDWPPHKAAAAIEAATGYRMVAFCDPLGMSIWQPYPLQEARRT